jgi:hypothetical protein
VKEKTQGDDHIKSVSGQSIMEYLILSSLIGIFCLGIIGQYGETIQKRIEYMKRQIVQKIELR